MYSWQVSRPLPGFLGQIHVLINYCTYLSHGTNVPKWESQMNAQIAPKVDTIRKITLPPSFSLDPIPIPTGAWKEVMMGRDHCASAVLFANQIKTRANLLHTLLGVYYFALWITVIWHPARLNEANHTYCVADSGVVGGGGGRGAVAPQWQIFRGAKV